MPEKPVKKRGGSHSARERGDMGIVVHVTPAEHERIRASADAAGLTIKEFCLRAALQYPIPDMETKMTRIKWIVGVEHMAGPNQNSVWSRPVEVWAETEEEAARRALGGPASQQGEGLWRRDFAMAHVSKALPVTG